MTILSWRTLKQLLQQEKMQAALDTLYDFLENIAWSFLTQASHSEGIQIIQPADLHTRSEVIPCEDPQIRGNLIEATHLRSLLKTELDIEITDDAVQFLTDILATITKTIVGAIHKFVEKQGRTEITEYDVGETLQSLQTAKEVPHLTDGMPLRLKLEFLYSAKPPRGGVTFKVVETQGRVEKIVIECIPSRLSTDFTTFGSIYNEYVPADLDRLGDHLQELQASGKIRVLIVTDQNYDENITDY